MSLIEKPVPAFIFVVIAEARPFVSTMICHLRKVQAFGSISALNALVLLLTVCIMGIALVSLWRASDLDDHSGLVFAEQNRVPNEGTGN